MKKNIFILAILPLLLSSCFAYKAIPVQIDPISKTIDVSLLKDDAWVKANNWMVKTFVSSESVIEFTDKEAGIINGKYNFFSLGTGTSLAVTTKINASVFIQSKDYVVRITVDPQDYSTIEGGALYDPYKYPKEEAIKSINALIEDFEDYMLNNKSLEEF